MFVKPQGPDRFGTIDSQFQELRTWLESNITWFEQIHLTKAGQAPMDYGEYTRFSDDTAAMREVYNRLRHLQETNKNVGISPEAWRDVETNWQKVEAQVREMELCLTRVHNPEMSQ